MPEIYHPLLLYSFFYAVAIYIIRNNLTGETLTKDSLMVINQLKITFFSDSTIFLFTKSRYWSVRKCYSNGSNVFYDQFYNPISALQKDGFKRDSTFGPTSWCR